MTTEAEFAYLGRLHVADTHVASERFDAITKHGLARTPFSDILSPEQKFVILAEEFGEVARAITYDEGDEADLKKELAQLGAMTSMWLASLQ